MKELTLNPSLDKRGNSESPFSLKDKELGDESES